MGSAPSFNNNDTTARGFFDVVYKALLQHFIRTVSPFAFWALLIWGTFSLISSNEPSYMSLSKGLSYISGNSSAVLYLRATHVILLAGFLKDKGLGSTRTPFPTSCWRK